MSILKKDIENIKKEIEDLAKHPEKVGYDVTIVNEKRAMLEALKFADKRFDEFVEKLKDELCRKGFISVEEELIDNIIEEFNSPNGVKYAHSCDKKGFKGVSPLSDNVQGCGEDFYGYLGTYEGLMKCKSGNLCDDCKKKGAKA